MVSEVHFILLISTFSENVSGTMKRHVNILHEILNTGNKTSTTVVFKCITEQYSFNIT